MSVEENKAIVRRFYQQVWNDGNFEVTAEIFATDYIRHDLRPTHAEAGPAGMAKIAADFRRAFPDLTFHEDLLLAEGDLVAARWTSDGTHSGSWGDVEPTRRRARFSGVNIFRLREGKVVEIWNHRDDLGLMEQLGVPVFAGAAPARTDKK
jgi:predicted ester cyclase